MLSQLWRLPALSFPPAVSYSTAVEYASAENRRGIPRPNASHKTPLFPSSAIDSTRWLFEQEKQKLFHTSSYSSTAHFHSMQNPV